MNIKGKRRQTSLSVGKKNQEETGWRRETKLFRLSMCLTMSFSILSSSRQLRVLLLGNRKDRLSSFAIPSSDIFPWLCFTFINATIRLLRLERWATLFTLESRNRVYCLSCLPFSPSDSSSIETASPPDSPASFSLIDNFISRSRQEKRKECECLDRQRVTDDAIWKLKTQEEDS